jgi:hypothetical protein
MTAMRTSRIALLLAVALATVAGSGCRQVVDPVTTLEPVDVVTGWFDAGIVSGKNKLVPSVSLKLRNKSSDQVRSVQVNAIFRRVGEMEMWGEHFTIGVPREGLAPGEVTKELVLQSQLGYTGEQPRLQLLQNSQFVDAKVELFAKYGSAQWKKMGEFPITRQLIEQP